MLASEKCWRSRRAENRMFAQIVDGVQVVSYRIGFVRLGLSLCSNLHSICSSPCCPTAAGLIGAFGVCMGKLVCPPLICGRFVVVAVVKQRTIKRQDSQFARRSTVGNLEPRGYRRRMPMFCRGSARQRWRRGKPSSTHNGEYNDWPTFSI